MEDRMYEVTLCNVPFKQAQALYRFLVDLNDEELLHGNHGMSWSGLIAGNRSHEIAGMRERRTITIRPMPTHEEVVAPRVAAKLKEVLNEAFGPAFDVAKPTRSGYVTDLDKREKLEAAAKLADIILGATPLYQD